MVSLAGARPGSPIWQLPSPREGICGKRSSQRYRQAELAGRRNPATIRPFHHRTVHHPTTERPGGIAALANLRRACPALFAGFSSSGALHQRL